MTKPSSIPPPPDFIQSELLRGPGPGHSHPALHMKAQRQPRSHVENMEDDFLPQVKKVAVAMGVSLTEQDVDRMPREMRTQGNFNYSRFLEYMRQFETAEQREEAIKKAFMMLDKDGSGYIEWNEIKYILSTVPAAPPSAPLSDEEAEALVQAVDSDGDGRIDYREFSDMVKMEKKPRK
ncbi:parvalbumin-like EF-hand-containing protein [Etheostoma spectabile]|uniref:parvalbumin-like EF-hand-containing protein n=1 Tax=Etheostoma spectabile TaxID=54343 RepID=UPI0013AFA504|nr:parvalbumin-like EF-hand-containing protein [Etheostoma spectabile]